MSWIDIGALEDIPRQGARVVKTAHGCVAVFRTLDDAVFALSDRCAHKAGPLSDGLVHDRKVPARCTAGCSAWRPGRRSGPIRARCRAIRPGSRRGASSSTRRG